MSKPTFESDWTAHESCPPHMIKSDDQASWCLVHDEWWRLPHKGLCQHCGKKDIPTQWVFIPPDWQWIDPAGMAWQQSWLCSSCCEDARMLFEQTASDPRWHG